MSLKMMSLKILIVDDEQAARRTIRAALVAQGFEVTDAITGEQAMEALRDERPDLILVDLNMPGMGGLEACRAIRACSEIPIIVISARKTQKDRVLAFEAGADQYLTKPFGVDELLARIRSMRRRLSQPSFTLTFGEVEVDLRTHEVKGKDRVLHLTAKEFRLLHFFSSHPDEVISYRRLLQAVWGPDYGNEVPYLRVFINQLRKKIEPDPSNPRYILTEPCSGYRLALPRKLSA